MSVSPDSFIEVKQRVAAAEAAGKGPHKPGPEGTIA